MTRVPYSRSLLPWILIALTQCSPTVSVRNVNPQPPAATGIKETKARPSAADLGRSLELARNTEARLRSGDRSAEAMAGYNYAVARVIESLEASGLDPWNQKLTIPNRDGTYQLKARVMFTEQRIQPEKFRMIPTDRYSIGGTYFQHQDKHAGVGAPVAVVLKNPGKGRTQRFKDHADPSCPLADASPESSLVPGSSRHKASQLDSAPAHSDGILAGKRRPFVRRTLNPK